MPTVLLELAAPMTGTAIDGEAPDRSNARCRPAPRRAGASMSRP
jgi:hypothetical protein